jgi:hypothetical protein
VLFVEKNMNDLNERTNMIVMLIIVGILSAAEHSNAAFCT